MLAADLRTMWRQKKTVLWRKAGRMCSYMGLELNMEKQLGMCRGSRWWGGRTKQNTLVEGKGWRKCEIFIWVSKEERIWRWGESGTEHWVDTMSLCHEGRMGMQSMVTWRGVEHATCRMEWKAMILWAYEGKKCPHLVYRSCSVQHSTYLCSLFGTLPVSVFVRRIWYVSASLNCMFTSVVSGLEDPCFNSRQSLKRT